MFSTEVKTVYKTGGLTLIGWERSAMRWMMCSVLALALGTTAWAAKRTGKDMSLKTLTDQSDSVIIGKCKDKNVQWVDKHLETSYNVEVQETLKGKSFKQGQTMAVTVPGGELTTPPLTQYVEMVPTMFPGEGVALFLKDTGPEAPPSVKARINPKSKLWTSPQVVGWSQGKFSVYTDKKDGRQKIARLNLEQMGAVPQSRALERLLHAVASGDVAVTSAPVVDLGDGVQTTPEGRDLFNRLSKAESANSANAAAVKKNVVPTSRGPEQLKAQDLEDFKAQVRKFAEENK
jgi:hypothetical protein